MYEDDNCIDTVTEFDTLAEACERIGKDLMFIPGNQIQLFVPQDFKTRISY